MQVFKLEALIDLNTKGYEAKLAEAGTQMKSMGDKLSGMGRAFSNFGANLTKKVTLPIVAVATLSAKKFAEVDKTMQLTNATMGNTAEQADMLNAAMKDAAANSTFGMSDAAQASLNFARAGLSAEQAAASLAPAMNLAAGEGGNLDTVSAGLVATINGFHGSFDDAAKYADVFANACNNSALDVDSLSSAMSVAAPIFSAAGYSVSDAALYMGVMANNGIEASVSANSLKTGFARLLKPTDDAAKTMDKLGISMTDHDGKMKDTVTIQSELHDSFSKLSESEQIAAASAIFGKNQMAPWLALINSAPEDVSKLNKQLGETGTTSEMAEAMMSGFGGSLEKLKSSIDVAATSFGEALAPMIRKVADKIQSLVDKFNGLSKEQKESIAKWALVAAAVGPAILVVGKFATAIGSIASLTSAAGSGLSKLAGSTAGMTVGATGAIAAVVGLSGALIKWAADSREAKIESMALDEQEQKTVDSLKETTKAYEEVDEARKNATSEVVSEAQYAHDLVDEYNNLIDSNGKVKEGYEGRVDFIKGQLAEALGVEKGAIDDLIGKNGKLESSVNDLIEAKKNEALLDANKDAYTKAIKTQQEATEKMGQALREKAEQEKQYADARAQYAKAEEQYHEHGGRFGAQYAKRMNDAKDAMEAAERGIKKQDEAIKGYQQTLSDTSAEITNYEGLASAIAEKDTAAIQQWSTALTSGIKTRKNSTQQELDEQAKTITEEYELIKKAYNNGEEGVTEQMVENAKKRADAAQKEAGIQAETFKSSQNSLSTYLNNMAKESSKKGNTARANLLGNLAKMASGANTSFSKVSGDAAKKMGSAEKSVSTSARNMKGHFPINVGQTLVGTLVSIFTKKKKGGDVEQTASKKRFAKAYDTPWLFNSPAIYNGALVGDRGATSGGEVVYGRNKMLDDMTKAVKSASAGNIVINLNYNASDDANDIVRDIARGVERYRMAGVI